MTARKANPATRTITQASNRHVLRWQWLFIGIAAVLLYINTIGHDYAQDDAIVITENEFTTQGISGIDDIFANESFVGYFKQQKSILAGSRYRPLSLVTFAIEWEFFGPNPHISHAINILLYALTCIMLYFVLIRLFSLGRWKNHTSTLPFITALLFTVHPVHTEAVANIKGRDELMCLLFGLVAIYYLFGYLRTNNNIQLGIAGVCYLLALLSKESAYTFVAIFPAAMIVFSKISNGKVIKLSGLFLGVAALGLLIRTLAIGTVMNEGIPELMNDPFLEATASEKYATIMFILGKYLQLIFFPYPLTHDYYPYQISLASWSDPMVILSVILYCMMIWLAIRWVLKKNIMGFGVFYFLATITLVSNILFPIGTFMNERFLFIPSVGLLLAIAFLLYKIPVYTRRLSMDKLAAIKTNSIKEYGRSFRKANPLGQVLLVVIVFACCYLTVDRNKTWKNNQTLFLTDIHTSVGSAKMNNAAGGVLFEMSMEETDPDVKQEQLQRSFTYLTKAVSIHPTYQAAWITLGNVYYFLHHDFENAIKSYLNAGGNDAMNNLMLLGRYAVKEKDFTNAVKCFETYMANKPGDAVGYLEAGSAFLEAGQADRAIDLLYKATQQFPNNAALFNKLGLAYGKGKNDIQSSIIYLQKSIELDATNPETQENLGVAYAMAGKPAESIVHLEIALQLNPADPHLYDNLGSAHMQMGNQQKATEYFNKAQQLRGN